MLSRYASQDLDVVGRALAGENELINTKPPFRNLLDSQGLPCLQSLNISNIIKASSDLASSVLGYVFRSLLPDVSLLMYMLANDILAVVNIY